MNEFDANFDDLLLDIDSNINNISEISNILIIGTPQQFKLISSKIKNFENIEIFYEEKVEDAIQLLLQEVIPIVILGHGSEHYDTVTASRVVRVNHPLARILIFSKSKGSNLVSDLVNNGSVDGFIHDRQATRKTFHFMLTEHLAKHEIDKMIVRYIANPPKLSQASYLLLDPSLSFGRENDPVMYVGLMITHNSVPRFSHFFEDLLEKDEILFSGYLTGISLIGKQLFSTNEPIKEINFGGISVIMKFVDEFQFSIFVRNLTDKNIIIAEDLIDEVIADLLIVASDEFKKHQTVRGAHLDTIKSILRRFEKANELTINVLPDMIQYNEYIMFIGDDLESLNKMKEYLERKFNFRIFITNDKNFCIEELKNNEYDVLFIDNKIKTDDPYHLAEYAKDISPHLQIVFRVNDLRASKDIIKALNSTQIGFIIKQKLPLKEISKITHAALTKALEIKQQSRKGVQGSHNQAIIAKSMIRGDEKKYLSEATPELHGMIISQNENLIYTYQPRRPNLIIYDQELLSGMVAALDSIGSEAFGSETIGSIEMGGAHVLIAHQDDYHFGYLVNHLDPNTSVVLTKDINEISESLYQIVKRYKNPEVRNPRIAKEVDNFIDFFKNKFEIN